MRTSLHAVLGLVALMSACSDAPALAGVDAAVSDAGGSDGANVDLGEVELDASVMDAAVVDAAHDAMVLTDSAVDLGHDAMISADSGVDAFVEPIDAGPPAHSFGSTPSDSIPGSGSRFGHAVAISGDGNVLAVSNLSTNQVFIYLKSGSEFSSTSAQTLTAPSGRDGFGAGLALTYDGAILAVCDHQYDSGNPGAVQIFQRDIGGYNTTPIQTVPGPVGASPHATFATSVAISSDGSMLAVGDRDYSMGAGIGGAVIVFAWSGTMFNTTPVQTLLGPEHSGDFGRSVAISGDGHVLVVGDNQYPFYGVAHRYAWTGSAFGTTPAQSFAAPTGADDFGTGVAISGSGNAIAVGDPDYTSGGRGAVYIFARSGASYGATELQRIGWPSDTTSLDFGYGVALTDAAETLVVADPASDATYVGGVFFFSAS